MMSPDEVEAGDGREEPEHGEESEAGVKFWCTQCKAYIPDHNWDFHEKYHDPDKEPPTGKTNIVQSQGNEAQSDGEIDRKNCPECGCGATEQIDITDSNSITDDCLIETRGCPNCYAGWTVTLKAVSIEVTKQPHSDRSSDSPGDDQR